jgi:hypothetical protein
MPDPISRLQLVRDEVDKAFGAGFAQTHPELVIATMNAASLDYAALAIARGLHRRRPDRARGGGAHRERARAHAGAAVTDVMNSHLHSITSSAAIRGMVRFQ